MNKLPKQSNSYLLKVFLSHTQHRWIINTALNLMNERDIASPSSRQYSKTATEFPLLYCGYDKCIPHGPQEE